MLDTLYMQVRKRANCLYHLSLLKTIFENINSFPHFVVATALKYTDLASASSSQINIYSEHSLQLCQQLYSPLPSILHETKHLLHKYNIDSIKSIATLCNKIQ